MHLKTISLPITPIPMRESYLSALVSTLSRNNLDEFRLFVNFEPYWNDQSKEVFQRMLKIVETLKIDKDIKINEHRLGLDKNLFDSIQRSFDAGSEFNLHLEDDLYLSPDALDLSRWYYETFKDSPDSYFCYGLCSGSEGEGPLLEIKALNHFIGWGWCCFKDNWGKYFVPYWFDKELAEKAWGKLEQINPEVKKLEYAWDSSILANCLSKKLSMLIPKISRSKHNGAIGQHTNTEVFIENFMKIRVNKLSYKDLGGNYLLTL